MAAFNHDGIEYRMVKHEDKDEPVVEYRVRGSKAWAVMSKNRLTREHEPKSPLWDWLREHGIRRAVSGRSGGQVVNRTKKVLSLSHAGAQLLERVSRKTGQTQGDIVERGIRAIAEKENIR